MLWVYLFSAQPPPTKMTNNNDYHSKYIRFTLYSLLYVWWWWSSYSFFRSRRRRRKSNQRLNNIMVAEKMTKTMQKNKTKTFIETKTQTNWENKSKNVPQKGSENNPTHIKFYKRKTKIVFRYIAYFWARLHYIHAVGYIFYVFSVYYSYTERDVHAWSVHDEFGVRTHTRLPSILRQT